MTFNKIEHNFTYHELDYAHGPNYQPCIKVSVFFKKKADINYETFFGHWASVHADLAVACKAFAPIQRYVQV
jgi:hypothetical protein